MDKLSRAKNTLVHRISNSVWHMTPYQFMNFYEVLDEYGFLRVEGNQEKDDPEGLFFNCKICQNMYGSCSDSNRDPYLNEQCNTKVSCYYNEK